MILVDNALARREAEGRPVRVGMIGAGFMGRGLANLILRQVRGMRLSVVYARTLDGARRAYAESGVEPAVVDSVGALDAAIERGQPAITDDPSLLPRAGRLDVLVDMTGDVEFGAQVTLDAIAHGRNLVSMNAELDATVGPILQDRARRAGVLYSGSDGDQPGVELNLYRFVRGLGLTPLVCGNVKGLHDPYRTPTTQAAFAAQWGQSPHMVTSFADGTKISIEQAIVANATGMVVPRRGMNGWAHDGHVDELTTRYDADELRALGGVVDYVVGARPAPGVYVLAAEDEPAQRHYLKYYKLGAGPLYSFYTPYHLCHLEVPNSIARVALFGDLVLAPLAGPVVEVVAAAKRDLRAGETLDRLGGYCYYGLCENAGPTAAQRLLPVGVAEGCRLVRDVPKDQVIGYDDVELPAGRLVDRLREEQRVRFGVSAGMSAGVSARASAPASHG